MAGRRALGVTVDLLIGCRTGGSWSRACPPMAGAAFFPEGDLSERSGPDDGAVRGAGAGTAPQHLRSRADAADPPDRRVTVEGPGLHLHARRVIIAAGAHSRDLAAQAGDRVPLETERGYHVEWDMAEPRLTRPACPTARGFYLCPMDGSAAGGGDGGTGRADRAALAAPDCSAGRRGAARSFPDLPETPDRNWLGFRPSLPDSLPVIGPSRGGADVIHAFGHGHLGVTMAPVTARIVADLVAGRAPHLDLAPVLPGRF